MLQKWVMLKDANDTNKLQGFPASLKVLEFSTFKFKALKGDMQQFFTKLMKK